MKFDNLDLYINDKKIEDKKTFLKLCVQNKIFFKKKIKIAILKGKIISLIKAFIKIIFKAPQNKNWKNFSNQITEEIFSERIKREFKLSQITKIYVTGDFGKIQISPQKISEAEFLLHFFMQEITGYFKEYSLKKKDVVLDLGSYQGYFSLASSIIVGKKGKILSFEPDDNNFKKLKENIKFNLAENIVPIKKGVGKEKGILRFSEKGVGSKIEKKGLIKIEVTDLDSELKRLKINPKKVSFIKMDIEGAEIEALEGMKNLLKVGSPHLAIASYHWRDGEQTYKKVEEILKKEGYGVKTGYPKHLTTWAWKN